jgi:hypothetical protein
VEQAVIEALNSSGPESFLDMAVKFQERWNFSNVLAASFDSTSAINVLQKLAPYFTITNNVFCSITRCRRF